MGIPTKFLLPKKQHGNSMENVKNIYETLETIPFTVVSLSFTGLKGHIYNCKSCSYYKKNMRKTAFTR